MVAYRDRRSTQRLIAALKKLYGACSVKASRPALEELLLGVLGNGTGVRKTASAIDSIFESFVDWNETRVASVTEIAESIESVEDAPTKAAVIKQVLNNLYAATGEMSLEVFREKEPHETLVLIENIEDFPEVALARATVLALGHAVPPLTPKVLVACRRMGLLNGRSDPHAQTRQIEKLVPKQDMFEFHWLVSHHANAMCADDKRRCSECPLRRSCRTGKRATTRKVSATRAAKARTKTKRKTKS